jgi:hypothetical protein
MRLPCRLSVADLAADLGAPADALEPIIGELVGRGAGTLAGGHWQIVTPAEVDALIAALGAYAG